MSKHTPGPWTITSLPAYTPHLMGADHVRIALLDDAHHAEEEQVANRALIAQAPEMRALLERLYDWQVQMGGWTAPCWVELEKLLGKQEWTEHRAPSHPRVLIEVRDGVATWATKGEVEVDTIDFDIEPDAEYPKDWACPECGELVDDGHCIMGCEEPETRPAEQMNGGSSMTGREG